MATTSISMVQNNEVSGVNYFTVNNPLAFIVEVGGTPVPDYLDVTIDSAGIFGPYKALKYDDDKFIFFAEPYLKSILGSNYFDELQTDNSLRFEYIQFQRILFRPPGLSSPYLAYSLFTLNGYRQFDDKNGACAVDFFNNGNENLIVRKGQNYYYFIADGSVDYSIRLISGFGQDNYPLGTLGDENSFRGKFEFIITAGQEMEVGIYHYASQPYPSPSDILLKTINVFEPIIECGYNQCLKFLDKNGLYKFLPFEGIGERSLSVDNIGNIEALVTSLKDSKGNAYSAGKKAERTRTMFLNNIPSWGAAQVEELMDSPVVYMYIGEDYTTSDLETDWLMVEVTNKSFSYSTKSNFINVKVNVKLPRQYTITKI